MYDLRDMDTGCGVVRLVACFAGSYPFLYSRLRGRGFAVAKKIIGAAFFSLIVERVV